MSWLSVTRDQSGADSMVNLPTEDVLYLEHDILDKSVYAFTEKEKFYIPGTLNYWAESLKAYGFEKGDRNVVVQLSKISRMERRPFYCAYFGDGEIKVSMSENHYKRIEKIIGAVDGKPAII